MIIKIIGTKFDKWKTSKGDEIEKKILNFLNYSK
jgi:hypothetical protein